MDCQEVYESLKEIVSDLAAGSELYVWYTQSNEGDHMFIVEGRCSSYKSNMFQPFANFVDDFDPKETQIHHTSDGAHFTFRFQEDELSNAPPEPTRSIDRITHRGAESQKVKECSNCRSSVGGLPYPPLTLVYPSEDSLSSPEKEYHHLCVTCSPGHFDDVTRGVDFFAVENGRVSKIGFEQRGEGYDADEWVEWETREQMDNPYIQDTIEVIDSLILDGE